MSKSVEESTASLGAVLTDRALFCATVSLETFNVSGQAGSY